MAPRAKEAVRSASRPTEGQLQPYDCSCAGDAELFFAAWCDSKLARCSIGEGALRPLCDVCRRCGRWVPCRSLTSSPSFSFSLSSVSSSSFFLSPRPVVYLFRLLFLLYTSCLSSSSYIVREVLSVREERYRQRERQRRKWRHHCRAKIGDEFTLSLAKIRTFARDGSDVLIVALKIKIGDEFIMREVLSVRERD